MGVVAPGSTHACPSARPSLTPAEILCIHGWGAGKSFWKFVKDSKKILFTPNLIFVELKPHDKFQNRRTTCSLRKVTKAEREKNKVQWQCTHPFLVSIFYCFTWKDVNLEHKSFCIFISSFFVKYSSMVHCPLSYIHCLLSIVHYPIPNHQCPIFNIQCQIFNVHCPQCLLFIVHCPLRIFLTLQNRFTFGEN